MALTASAWLQPRASRSLYIRRAHAGRSSTERRQGRGQPHRSSLYLRENPLWAELVQRGTQLGRDQECIGGADGHAGRDEVWRNDILHFPDHRIVSDETAGQFDHFGEYRKRNPLHHLLGIALYEFG